VYPSTSGNTTSRLAWGVVESDIGSSGKLDCDSPQREHLMEPKLSKILTVLLIFLLIVDIALRIFLPVGRYQRMNYDGSSFSLLDTMNGKVLFITTTEKGSGEKQLAGFVLDVPALAKPKPKPAEK
jgi:hypothetical protein